MISPAFRYINCWRRNGGMIKSFKTLNKSDLENFIKNFQESRKDDDFTLRSSLTSQREKIRYKENLKIKIMLKIRLRRIGKKNQPYYQIVVADHRAPVKGRFIEILGSYNPRAEKNKITSIKLNRVKHWLKEGAHLTPTTNSLLKPYLKK